MLPLSSIEVFSRVVETGSFSKAARALNIGQPAVTKQVAAIEKALGLRLINRNTRGISITESGARFYKKCRQIIENIEDIEVFAEQEKSRVEGVLRISASLAFGQKVISPLLISFADGYPEICVDLTCGNPYSDLISQGVDVAIRMGALPDSSLGSSRIGTSPWGMIASPAYVGEHGTPENLDDLKNRDGLVYSSLHNTNVWNYRLPTGERRPIVVRERIRSNNLMTILDAASAGLGVAIVPLYLAAPALSSGRIVRLLRHEPLHEQEINAVFPSPTLVPTKVKTFLSFARKSFEDEWWLAHSES
jgi:DNA-binding transcriptional LysR family regulator